MKKNLKKLFALLLVVVMVAAMFAGCANNTETPAEPTTPSDTTDTTPTEDTTSTEEPAATETRENKVIYGSSTEISGDLGNAWWTNNASDKAVRDLMTGKTHNVQGGYVTLALGACEGAVLGRAEA